MKKKAPKFNKAKVKGYIDGGTILKYQDTDWDKVAAAKLAQDNAIVKPKSKGETGFWSKAGDLGRIVADDAASLIGFQNAVKSNYRTDWGQRAGETNDKVINPIMTGAGAVTANLLLPGSGAAILGASAVDKKVHASKLQMLPGETPNEYSTRMAAMGVDIEDKSTGIQGLEGALAGAGTMLGGAVKKKWFSDEDPEEGEANEDDMTGGGDDNYNYDSRYNQPQTAKNGGKIKGPGTAKSDSIKASIEPGAFVVPAENAKIAQKIREKYFGKDKEVANMNQGKGVPVKVSNGEHLFTPEEVKFLNSKGVDLSILAPDAEDPTELKKGGSVDKAIALGVKKLQDSGASDAIVEQFKKDASKNWEKYRTSGEAKEDVIEHMVSDFVKDIDTRKSFEQADSKIKSSLSALDKAEADLKKVGLTPEMAHTIKYNSSKQAQAYRKAAKAFEDVYDSKYEADEKIKGRNQFSGSDYLDKPLSDRRKQVAEAQGKKYNSLKDAVDDYNSEDAVAKTESKKTSAGVKPKGSSAKSNTSVSSTETASNPELDNTWEDFVNGTAKQAGPRVGDTEGDTSTTDDRQAIFEKMGKGQTLNADEIGTGREYLKEKNIGAEGADVSKKKNKEREKGFTPFLEDAVGTGQLLLGLNESLNNQRPVDTYNPISLDPTFAKAVASATDRSAYGLSPEEKAIALSDIESNRRAMVDFASDKAGGNFATAMANSRAAGNLSDSSKLDLYAQDRDAKLQKQQYADQLLGQKAAMSLNIDKTNRAAKRQLFDDNLNAFNQNQAGASELLNAGLENILAGARVRRATDFVDTLKDKENNYTGDINLSI